MMSFELLSIWSHFPTLNLLIFFLFLQLYLLWVFCFTYCFQLAFVSATNDNLLIHLLIYTSKWVWSLKPYVVMEKKVYISYKDTVGMIKFVKCLSITLFILAAQKPPYLLPHLYSLREA